MRITNSMITTKYLRSVNTLSTGLDKLYSQMTTGRAFSRSSENTAAAIKAYQIRKEMTQTEGYQANIQHAQSSLTNAESSLTHIEELMKSVKDRILQANTASASADERKIAATELRSIQESLLQALNSNSTDGYYFGGANTQTKPFTVDASGQLMYNGQLLSGLTSTDADHLSGESMYVDIGLGLRTIPAIPPNPANSTVDPDSVFHYTIPGINITGSGTMTLPINTTISSNLYDLIGKMADELESPSYTYESVDELYGAFRDKSMNVVFNLTEIGAKTSYLDFMTDRYETRTGDLEERQDNVEFVDPARAIIDFKSQQVAYNAALQMGAQIIPPSIFNYMK